MILTQQINDVKKKLANLKKWRSTARTILTPENATPEVTTKPSTAKSRRKRNARSSSPIASTSQSQETEVVSDGDTTVSNGSIDTNEEAPVKKKRRVSDARLEKTGKEAFSIAADGKKNGLRSTQPPLHSTSDDIPILGT